MLTKEQILAAPDLKRETVTVLEWGGDVIVSEMTAADKDAYELGLFDGEGANRTLKRDNMRARTLSFCLVDENGDRMFTEEEVVKLGKKNGKVVSRLFDIANRLNDAGEGAIDAAKKPSDETHG